jgi:hypothetical protein
LINLDVAVRWRRSSGNVKLFRDIEVLAALVREFGNSVLRSGAQPVPVRVNATLL